MSPVPFCSHHVVGDADDSLGTALADLEDVVDARGWGCPPLVGHLGDDASLRLDELAPGAHPAAHLWGTSAPVRAVVVLCAAEGWAAEVGGGSSAGRERVQVVVAVDRDGRPATRWRRAGEPWSSPAATGDGHLLDVLQRHMGAPTQPPDEPLSELWHRLWAALAIADGEGRFGQRRPAATWAEVLALHPCVTPGTASVTSVEFAARLVEWAALDWGDLRLAAASGRLELAGLTPDDARWADDGLVCRWLLAETAALDDLLAQADDVLEPQVAERLRLAVGGSAADG